MLIRNKFHQVKKIKVRKLIDQRHINQKRFFTMLKRPSIIHPNFQTYSIKIYSFQHQSIQILVPHQVKSHLREGNARKKIERKEKKRTQRQRESSRGGSHSMEWKFIHANLFHEDQYVSPVSFLSFFPSFLSSKGEERNWNFFRLR